MDQLVWETLTEIGTLDTELHNRLNLMAHYRGSQATGRFGSAASNLPPVWSTGGGAPLFAPVAGYTPDGRPLPPAAGRSAGGHSGRRT